MITFRPYEATDKQSLRNTCIRTSNPRDELYGDERPAYTFLTLTYNDYYTEHEPQNCFVLDDGGEAVGYIICSTNCARWRKIFTEEYLPRLKAKKQAYCDYALPEIFIHSVFAKEYPAHLHIDIDKPYRNKGYGKMMMDKLIEHLKAEGIGGVQLLVDDDNLGGIRFYQRYGFKILMRSGNNICMGLKF